MYFDTHAHLTHCSHLTLEEQFRRYRATGVTHILDPGLWVDDFHERHKLLYDYPEVIFGVALAPHRLKPSLSEPDGRLQYYLDLLDQLLKEKEKYRIKALAEIGLDFSFNQDLKHHCQQEDLFLSQLVLARKYDLPVFLHVRGAYRRTFELIRESGWRRGAIHCFTGSKQDAENFLDWGFHLSFSGIVTFKNAKDLQEIATYVPSDRMLSETDAPFLSPHPLRGKKNDSSHLVYINQLLSELKQIPLEEMNEILLTNARKLLNVV